ncbi:hypothetical protein QZH41_014593, partial [Actinostola sp. cb2023]
AKVNVAAPGTRKVQQKAAESEFTCEPGLQWEALKQLKEANPKGRFWLKADACDIKAVLQQSTRRMVTDGEFNSLRTQGETRATHIWQLLHDARQSVCRQTERTLLQMLTKTGEDANGNPITAIVDETIPKNVIQDLHNMNVNNGFSMEDAVTFIRGRLVPPGYQAHPFRTNTPESYLDKLRSLVATYRYRHCVKLLKEGGIDFSLYVYIPETDPTTGDVFHEREDHCHILKRIWKHTREGGPDDIDVTAFDEAMRDPNTGLTHAALTGERKQSVVDAERMLSILVGRYLRDHGHEREAEPVKGICGFSRETVIAVTSNIESIEFRRRQSIDIGYEEHPRAGTSDDVEAIFAMLHRFLGNIFTLKEFKACWRKVVREYCKRMDRNIPFYYWTSNERFREWDEELPSFNEASEIEDDQGPANHPLRLHRLTINRREDSSVFTAGRSFLPARNKTTVRHRIHRPVVNLPPT